MFDLILALIILPVFFGAAVCFRSWLIFNEAQKMSSVKENDWNEELEIIFRNDAEEICSDKDLLEFDRMAN